MYIINFTLQMNTQPKYSLAEPYEAFKRALRQNLPCGLRDRYPLLTG